MRTARLAGAVLLMFGAALLSFAGDVVVFKGGVLIELKGPWVRRGNAALLTRVDGTLISVAVSEIDVKATAAAKASRAAARPDAVVVAAPPQNPAQAARLSRDRPKARMKISDADVRHGEPAPAETEKKQPDRKVRGLSRARRARALSRRGARQTPLTVAVQVDFLQF